MRGASPCVWFAGGKVASVQLVQCWTASRRVPSVATLVQAASDTVSVTPDSLTLIGASIRALELERGGVRETVDEPDEALLQALSRLDATSIVADALGPAESQALGLAPARLHLRVVGDDGVTLAALSFGREDPGRGPVVRADGSETVFRVGADVLAKLDDAR